MYIHYIETQYVLSETGIFWYASVSTPDSYIIIGGTIGTDIRDAVVELKDNIWGKGISMLIEVVFISFKILSRC